MNDEQLKVIREHMNRVSRAMYAEEAADASYPETVIGVQRLNKTDLMGIVDFQLRDIGALLEHVAAQAERIQKLEAALREIVDIKPVKMSGVTLYPLAFGLAQGIAERALSDWTPFADIVAGVDEDAAHGG